MTEFEESVSTEQTVISFYRATQYHRQQPVSVIDESHPYFKRQGRVVNTSPTWNQVLVDFTENSASQTAQKPELSQTFWLRPDQVKIVLQSIVRKKFGQPLQR